MNLNFEKTKKMLIDHEKNRKIFSISTYVILGMISLIMTIMNIFTDKGLLTWCTGAFVVLCIVNIALVLIGKEKGISIATGLFAVELLGMFTFFMLSGNPEGFSAIWICLLPALGMLFFGRLYGSVVSAAMMMELIFFFWIPAGRAVLPDVAGYTDSFLMRFPVLYFASFLIAILLETLRSFTYEEMDRMRRIYRELSVRDQLTGLYNRQGMFTELEAKNRTRDFRETGLMMFDIDHFKAINDSFGHAAGDEVLKSFARLLNEELGGMVCRWGGEEFLGVCYDDPAISTKLENFRKKVEEHVFRFENAEIHITVSIGLLMTPASTNERIDRLIEQADRACYAAKRGGRNNLVIYRN